MNHLLELGSEVGELGREVDGRASGRDGAGGLGLEVRNGSGSGLINGNGNGLRNGDGVRGLNGEGEGDAFFDNTDVDGAGLVERVRRVWETSERVGGKVRRLDEEIGRVREAMDIVTEVLELKVGLSVMFSLLGVLGFPFLSFRGGFGERSGRGLEDYSMERRWGRRQGRTEG